MNIKVRVNGLKVRAVMNSGFISYFNIEVMKLLECLGKGKKMMEVEDGHSN
jgi:hypothetical protein